MLVAPAPRESEPVVEEMEQTAPHSSGVSARAKFMILLSIGVIFLAAVLQVAMAARVNGLGYRLTQMENDNLELERANQRLELEVARLKDPARLATVAQQQLGMVRPDAAHISRLPAGTLCQAQNTVRGEEGPVLTEAQDNNGFWDNFAGVFTGWLAAGKSQQAGPLARN